MATEDLREQFAAIEHERWAHWQSYMHAQCELADNGRWFIPTIEHERWEQQIATPYAELSEAEKASDREQVDRYWPLIEAILTDRDNYAARLKAQEVWTPENVAASVAWERDSYRDERDNAMLAVAELTAERDRLRVDVERRSETCTCPWNNGYHPPGVLGHHVNCPGLTRRHYSGDGCPTVGVVHAGHRDPAAPPTGWLDPAEAEQLQAELAAARAAGVAAVMDVDRQWCANIDAVMGTDLSGVAATTITQLRTERDEGRAALDRAHKVVAAAQVFAEWETRRSDHTIDADVWLTHHDNALRHLLDAVNEWRAQQPANPINVPAGDVEASDD